LCQKISQYDGPSYSFQIKFEEEFMVEEWHFSYFLKSQIIEGHQNEKNGLKTQKFGV
jgi:hypothetical protein